MIEITAYQLARLALLIDPEAGKSRIEARWRRALEKAYRYLIEAQDYLDHVEVKHP